VAQRTQGDRSKYAPGSGAIRFGHPDRSGKDAFCRGGRTIARDHDRGVDILDGKIERAIANFGKEPDGGLIALLHPHTLANRGPIIQLAAENRLPTVYPFRSFAAEGGLLAYGPDQNDQWRYQLAINLKTAKAIVEQTSNGSGSLRSRSKMTPSGPRRV